MPSGSTNKVVNAQFQEISALREKLARIHRLVERQAEDEGLWFDAETAPEAYLQVHLRELHRVIEAP